MKRLDLSETTLLLAGEIKANYSVSLADSFIAAATIENEAILVHKDHEYEGLEGRVQLCALPYKGGK